MICLCLTVLCGGGGAFIYKVIVTDFVSDASADSDLTKVFCITKKTTGLHKESALT